jgi:GMP synthase (glutamine-hydrolysing)
MRILIIDNNIDRPWWGSENLRRYARAVPGATVVTRRAPQDDLPESPAAFDRIVVSGSKTAANDDAPWIDRLLEFVRRAVDQGKPFLGVCYGHQTLARAFGGSQAVRRGDQGEFGWAKIETLSPQPLFKDLPDSFYSYQAHYDEVHQLPKGFTCFAKSEICPIQAIRLEGKPVFGIQFHPEKNLAEAERNFEEERKSGRGRTLLNADASKKLFDPKVGDTIFGNFFTQV